MTPPLVARARAAGLAPCSEELGRLLHVLAGQRGRARVAQVGGGAEAAWLVSALRPGVPFFWAEADARAADAFAEDVDVRLLPGDPRAVLRPEAPFDLLVVRGAADERLVDLLAPGGTLVAASAARHPRLVAVELQVSSRESVLVGTLQA